MFEIGEQVGFAFDEQRRLRISVPEGYLPLAAWLHTDAQPNLQALDGLGELLRQCEQHGRTLLGNGCAIAFSGDLVMLESLYERWPRTAVPREFFWAVLSGLRNFLVATSGIPELARPQEYPAVTRALREVDRPDGGPKLLVDHTYFPPEWSDQEVREAGEGAWQSPECVLHEETGVWSGMWRGLELAGYYNPATGEPQVYFPVLSP
jgi:hypothetical protein